MFYSPKRKYIPENNTLEEQEINKSEEKEKENNIDENIEKYLNEIEEYELEFDDEKYNLKTGYSKEKNSIYLKITPVDSKNTENKNIIIFYEKLYSSDDLTKLCKSFRMYDSIEEIFSAFCVIFENKKAYLKPNNENENDNNILYLVIVVGSVTGKEDEICLSLQKKEFQINLEEKKGENNNNIIINNQCNCQFKEKEKEIYLKIERIEKDLRAENYELKNEIFYLKDDINRYKKTIDSNKKEIKNLKTQIKELKNLFEEKIKNLTEKYNSIKENSNIINDDKNFNKDNKNLNINNQPDKNLNINKEIEETENGKNNEKEVKNNIQAITPKKSIIQTHKNNNSNTNNQKKNNKPKTAKNQKNQKNQENKINSKREIYQQMKAANAQKLNNANKDKPSFGEFIKQRKNAAASNKLIHSIEIKEPTKDNKNKVLQKNKTDFIPETKIKVNQSVVINKSKFELEKEEEKKENEIEKENNEESFKEEAEEEEKEKEDNIDNIDDNININNENNNNENNNENEANEENEDKNEDEGEIHRIKTYDLNRGDKIDQWKFDFDLNVKKLLQDNESKLKLAEKLNNMNRRIINNIEELQLIENQLFKNYPDTKEIEYTLLYRATENGDSVEIFHEKCDHIPFTLTIIKNIDGNKFGGYTEESWEGKNKNKKDYNAFCFSLSKNKIYNIKPEKSAIICDPNLGPSFGDPLFKIVDNFFNNKGKSFPKDKCGFSGQDINYEITNGVEDFEIQEIEIYKINFI